MLAIQLKMKIKQRKKAGMSMDIIFYHPTFDTAYWIKALSAALPGRACVNGSAVITNMQTTRWSGIPGRDARGAS